MKKAFIFCLLSTVLFTCCSGRDGVASVDVENNLPPEIVNFSVDTITVGDVLTATLCYETKYADRNVLALHNLNTNAAMYDTINASLCKKEFELNREHNYEFYLKAINKSGYQSDLRFVFINYNPEYWSLTVGQTGQTIRYTVAYGVMQIDYPVVQSEIYTTAGIHLLSQHSPEKTIDVSGISRGVYVLKVTLANGVIVSKRFAIR